MAAEKLEIEQQGETVADTPEAIKEIARRARLAYEASYGQYEDFARSVAGIISYCIGVEHLIIHSVNPRAKSPDSFEKKASRTKRDAPSEAKYSEPLEQITDKAGVRVITYFLGTIEAISRIVSEQFDVIERLDKGSTQPERIGYRSIHFLVKLTGARTSLPEYRRFSGLVAEIQVRTILQHTWAEIEHDIQYKAVDTLPTSVRRRFIALAGLIEIADREFQAIDDENRALLADAKRKIQLGQLDQVEVTRDSIRAYLDEKYGPDGRVSEWSYDWVTRLLIRLGFANLQEVDDCISGYNDDKVSRALYGTRRGQMTRFEDVLLTSMGKYFVEGHPWTTNPETREWWVSGCAYRLDLLQSAGISRGNYKPPGYPDGAYPPVDLTAKAAD